MYWSADTGAHLLRGEMLKAWRNQGAQRSFLGYPTSDQASEAPVRFQRGTMRPTARLPEIVPDQRTIMTGQINLDGVAANGRATLLITSAGLWNYSGTVRATGALSYDFRIATALDFADAAGTGRAFFAQGDVEGTLTLGGNREHKWEDWGSDNWIRDNWDALVTCGTHTALTVEFTFDQLMGHIGTILGIPLIVIGVLLAAAFVDDNYDVCGGEDPDGSKHVTFVPKGQSCPPGETKQPRRGAGDTNGDMVGGGGPPG
jgi:hypothetical protein